LNDHGGVSPETSKKVMEVVASSGYRKRGNQRKAKTLDILVNNIDSQWALTLVTRATQEVQKFSIDASVTLDIEHGDTAKRWLERVVSRGSLGAILVMSSLPDSIYNELKKRHVPIILIDPVSHNDTKHAQLSISATNWAGGLTGTKYLIEKGHTKIAVITGPLTETLQMDRLDGYRSALTRAGIPINDDYIKEGAGLYDSGLEKGLELLSLPDPPTAIFSFSDEQAAGVYEAARKVGVLIPQDVSVVGFDDVTLCHWLAPQLTTVHQPLDEMSAVAVNEVLSYYSNSNTSLKDSMKEGPKRLELPIKVVERDSVQELG
jgi:DNA-binding LacI/PurR family transcriptional regulator